MILGQAELKGKHNVKMFSFVHIWSTYVYIESISLPSSQSPTRLVGDNIHTYIDNVGF